MTTGESPTIIVLDPTAPPRQLRHDMAVRPSDIRGKRIGFLWNSKPNGDVLFERIEKLLREKYEISDAMYRRKPTSSAPATEQVLEELAGSVDIAVVGLGD